MRRQRAMLAWILVASTVAGATGARGQGGTAAVYPPRPGGLVMSHATPAHRALACADCHAAAAHSTRSADSLLPREAACARCHEARMDRARPTRESCGYCHRGFDPPASPAIAPARAEPAQLHFSHARHAGAACDGCHGAAASPRLPEERECMRCHQRERALPCAGCHETLPDGRLRTRFDGAVLVPRRGALAHGADFSVRHRWLAADEPAACRSCHVERDCERCHDGRARPRGLHGNDYLALHAQDAQRGATRCPSCHTPQSFCLACHARLGLSSVSAPDLASPRRLHPPSRTWVRGESQHAQEARRALDSCVGCHAERDCVQCHGARGIGAGLSPHPRGFRARCASPLAANPRPCIACHGDSAALEGLCR